jgi:beta-glucanase (GH16 family)
MSCQLAPFNNALNLTTGRDAVVFYGSNRTENELNAYQGAVYQQTASVLVTTDNDVYEDTGGRFERYGFEYKPGYDADSHITWTVGDDMQWRLGSQALAADPAVEISARPIPLEPMYIIMNLGLSSAFSYVDFDRLHFPARMEVDWVRVYQDEDKINVGCDPPDFPTKEYIERHYEAYHNPNLTTWTEPRARGGMNMQFPGNRLAGDC